MTRSPLFFEIAGTVGEAADRSDPLLWKSSLIPYTPAGTLSALPFQNGVTESHTWNSLWEPTAISAGSLLSLNYAYCDPNDPATNGGQRCASKNTGSPFQQQIVVGGQTKAIQEYVHDALNRVTMVAEKTSASSFTPTCPDTTSVWCRQFGYDNSGNMTVTKRTPDGSNSWDAASFNAKNQVVGSSWGYDSAGNLIKGPSVTLGYDAEGRQVSYCTNMSYDSANCPNQTGPGRTWYVYDGSGNRVQKTDQNNVTTTYVYDAFGGLAAEYGVSTTLTQGTQYLTTDALGSTRLVMSGSQASERHDYQPFGLESFDGAWRAGVTGYGVDTVRQKFTGQERDDSYLDYFKARYFSGIQGRFLSPDPGNAGANPADPQSWNGYAYVSNNPLMYTDPDGLGIFGDIGSIVGSFFPGLGTLIGWGIGSIADLATGQSISPPGLVGIGSDIFGGIAGSVNNGQPWNEQWPIGGGGSLNTGTVFGSGNTGPFIFSFEDQQGQYLNGRLLLPSGDVAIWGIGGGQGGAVLHGVYQRTGGLARGADKVAGCVADRAGLGSLVGGTMVAAGQPIIPTRAKFGGDLFGPSILRGNPPTAGTSPASWLARKTIPGAADWLGKTVTSAGIKNTAKLGGAVGRAVPVIGWGILAYDAVKAGACIAQ